MKTVDAKKVRISATISPALEKRLRRMEGRVRRPFSWVIEDALTAGLDALSRKGVARADQND